MATVHLCVARGVTLARNARSCFYGPGVKRHSGGINYIRAVRRRRFGLQISVSTCSLKYGSDPFFLSYYFSVLLNKYKNGRLCVDGRRLIRRPRQRSLCFVSLSPSPFDNDYVIIIAYGPRRTTVSIAFGIVAREKYDFFFQK